MISQLNRYLLKTSGLIATPCMRTIAKISSVSTSFTNQNETKKRLMNTVTPSSSPTTAKRYKIVFFVPEDSKELVKERLFSIGAGRASNYDKCSFETSGTGQFRPLKGSQPYIGEEGVLEKVPEYRVEMLCQEDIIKDAIKELVSAHPYEEPAYEVYEILNI